MKKKLTPRPEDQYTQNFYEAWDILKWEIKDSRIEGWQHISKESAFAILNSLKNIISGVDKTDDQLNSLKNIINGIEGADDKFRKSFADFVLEVQKSIMDGWTTTSKEAALHLMKISIGYITV